jgi:ATP-dependent RNA helicase RhlE
MLKNKVDILVATPGRLNDLIGQKLVDLSYVEIFVLDEADHMLDMGFINDVKKIIAKIPKKKQTLLFSATIPDEISKMADSVLINPIKIAVTPVSSAVDIIKQYLYFVDRKNKQDLLLHLLNDKAVSSALVFTRTKHGADRVVRFLTRENISAQAIHGNKSQNARQLALDNFKQNNTCAGSNRYRSKRNRY